MLFINVKQLKASIFLGTLITVFHLIIGSIKHEFYFIAALFRAGKLLYPLFMLFFYWVIACGLCYLFFRLLHTIIQYYRMK